jgi:FtsH-binding integral membrane protein
MICSIKNQAERRYVIRMWVTAGLCVLCSLVAALTFKLSHPHGILAYLVAILPSLPIMGALFYTGVFLAEEKDEFQRNLLVQALLGGIGCTLSLITAWGNLEDFAHAPHLDLIWVYPLFWLFAGISYGVVWARYR